MQFNIAFKRELKLEAALGSGHVRTGDVMVKNPAGAGRTEIKKTVPVRARDSTLLLSTHIESAKAQPIVTMTCSSVSFLKYTTIHSQTSCCLHLNTKLYTLFKMTTFQKMAEFKKGQARLIRNNFASVFNNYCVIYSSILLLT